MSQTISPADRMFLPVLAGAVILLIVLAAIIWAPIGPPTMVRGRVVAIGAGRSRSGARPWLTIDLSDRRTTISTFAVLRCAVGDTLEVRRQRRVWGPAFSAGAMRCKRAGPGVARLGRP
ncbi:hypothetical protein [Phenylobacterium sp.]|uniref:hypothetical protein n=1 Tax=Phenylobacterium sp. TaxID=1871053 RepID=UPI0035688DEC